MLFAKDVIILKWIISDQEYQSYHTSPPSRKSFLSYISFLSLLDKEKPRRKYLMCPIQAMGFMN